MIFGGNDTLRNIYKLDYDSSSPKSGLIIWYNKLIDKTMTELDVIDVSKMVRQDILKEIAIDRAIELFLENPFEGEMRDGDLLALLTSIDWSKFSKNGKLVDAAKLITQLESTYLEFEWTNESESESYKHNLRTLKENLAH